MKKLVHYHIMIRAEVQTPKALSVAGLHHWAEKIVRDQNLEPVIGPNVVYVDDKGNEGPTGGVNIKTSHFAFHIWDVMGIIQADLYTCGELDVDLFLSGFEIFDPTCVKYLVLDREGGFNVIRSDHYDIPIDREAGLI